MLINAANQSDKRFKQTFIGLMTVLFLAVPVFYQVNPGGEGLMLPFNSATWLVVSFIIGLALIKMLTDNLLRVPSISGAMMIFLATTTLLGIVNSVLMPEAWLFRSLALWGGILFYLAIPQFNLATRAKDWLLLLLLFSAATQGLIGILQILLIDSPITWLPTSPGIPRGIFQQPNLNASYCATGVIVGIYIVTRPSFLSRSVVIQGLAWVAIGLSLTTVVTSGSRVGLLGTLVAGLLIISCRWQYWRFHSRQLLILAFTLTAFTVTAMQLPTARGLDSGLEKMARSTDSSQDVRIMMYDSSWELIKESPVLGYGIGQFQPVWHEHKIDYLQRHPDAAVLQPRLSHPHNELLYWAIEGGLAAVIGILVMALAFLWRACQLGWQRGGSYIAMVIPIAVHTQVELPFYISQLHWIIFAFLIAQVGHHRVRRYSLNLSAMARNTVLALAILIPVATSIFTAKNLTALHLAMNFVTGKDRNIETLAVAGNNLYFSRWITAIQMQIIFQAGYQTDDTEILSQYVPMARTHLETIPDLQVMTNLSLALHKLGQYDDSHRVLLKAALMYPGNPLYLSAQKKMIALDKEQGIFERYWRASSTAE